MKQLKTKLMTLLMTACCAFACLGVGFAIAEPNNEITAKAATTEELTAEFTNNGQFALATSSKTTGGYTVIDGSAAKSTLPAGYSGSVLEIYHSSGSDGYDFVTVDFSNSKIIAQDVESIVVRAWVDNFNSAGDEFRTIGAVKTNQRQYGVGAYDLSTWCDVPLTSGSIADMTDADGYLNAIDLGLRDKTAASHLYIDSITVNLKNYAVHELGAITVHGHSNGTTANVPKATALYMKSSITLPFTTWDDKFNLHSGDGFKLNGNAVTTGQLISADKNLYVNLSSANVQVGDVLSISGTFVHTTEPAKYVIDESKFIWTGLVWENYIAPTTYEIGQLAIDADSTATSINFKKAISGAFEVTDGSWAAKMRFITGTGVGVTFNGTQLAMKDIKLPNNIYLGLEGNTAKAGDELVIGGTFYFNNGTVAANYVIEESKFIYNGSAWEKVVNYATYTVTKVGMAGGSTVNTLYIYSLEGDTLPKDQGDWNNVYSPAADASVKLNDTVLTPQIKMPGDLYVPLGVDANVGDVFTINGTFYNEAKAIKLVFDNCQLQWNGTAWVEVATEPPVVEYATYELNGLTLYGNSATTDKANAAKLHLIASDFTHPAEEIIFTAVENGVGLAVNDTPITWTLKNSASQYLYLTFNALNTGDKLTIGGTFVNEEKAVKYVIEETVFLWNGTAWEKYIEYTEVSIGRLGLKSSSSEASSAHNQRLYLKTDGNSNFVQIEGVEEYEVAYVSGTHVLLNDEACAYSRCKVVANGSNFYLKITVGGQEVGAEEGDKVTFGGVYVSEEYKIKYTIEDSEFIWNGTAWEEYVEYTTYNVGDVTFKQVGAEGKHIYFSPVTTAGFDTTTWNSGWDTVFSWKDGIGVTINGETVSNAKVKFPGSFFIEFATAPQVGDILRVGGTYYNTTVAKQYIVNEIAVQYNGTAWEKYIEYDIYNVSKITANATGCSATTIQATLTADKPLPDNVAGDWTNVYTFEAGSGTGLTLGGTTLTTTDIKYPGSIYVGFGATAEVGDALTIDGTFYNNTTALKFVFDNCQLFWNGTAWVDSYEPPVVEYAITELGTLKVHSNSAGTTTNAPKATQIYMSSTTTLPFQTWSDIFNLESGAGWTLNGNPVTIGNLVSSNAGLFVDLTAANVQVGDVLSVSGTFVHTTELAKYVIDESKFVWDGVAWENYEDYTKEYTTQECGSLKFSSWTAGEKHIYLARADKGGFNAPADNNNGWTATFRAKHGVGVTLNGKLIKKHANLIKFPGGNMFINIKDEFAEGAGPVEGDKLVIGGTFYNIDLAVQYVVTETTFVWNGTTWEKEYTTSELNGLTLYGNSATTDKANAGKLHLTASDFTHPAEEFIFTAVENGVGLAVNDTPITWTLKNSTDQYLYLTFDALNAGDKLTIGGTFVDEQKSVKYIIEETTFWWNGSAWVTEPPVFYTEYTLGALKFQKVGGENKHVYLISANGADIPNSDWAEFILESGIGVMINDAPVNAVVKFPNALFIEFENAPEQGDKLTIGGTFYNEELLVKYIVPENTLYWDEEKWNAVDTSEYVVHNLGELLVASPSAGASAKATQLYLKKADGTALPFPDASWNTEFVYQSGIGVLLNGQWLTISDLESSNSGLFLQLANAGVKTGDVLTIGGTYQSADVSAKYVITESSFMWNGSFWVNYITDDRLAAYDIITIQDIDMGSEKVWEGTVNEVTHSFAPSEDNTTNSVAFRFGYNSTDVAVGTIDIRLRGANWEGFYFRITDGIVEFVNHSDMRFELTNNVDYEIELGAIDMKEDGRVWIYIKVDGVLLRSKVIARTDSNAAFVTSHVSIYTTGIASTTLTDPDGIKVAYVSSAGTHVEKVKKNELYNLAAGKTLKTFIGWAYNGVLYAPGTEFTVTSAMTFTAVEIDFTMDNGAAIRLGESADYSGIRFTSMINQEELNGLLGAYGITDIAYGTLIMPYDYLNYGEKPNLEDFKVETNQIAKIANSQNVVEDGYIIVRGAMQKLYEENYARLFAGRAYMEIKFASGDVWTIYTAFDNEDNVRSIRQVAIAFKADTSEPKDEDDLRYNGITVAQQEIVNAYIGTEGIKLMNYEAYAGNAMSIIAWNFPALDPTNNYMNDANIAVANTMKEAGIQVIGLTGANILSMNTAVKIEQTRQIIDFFWTQGIGTFAFQNNGGNNLNNNFATSYPDFSDCEGFIGFLAWDEPSLASIDTIATQVEAFEAAYAGTDVTFMGNLLPSYAETFMPDGNVDKAAYKAYLQKYCDVVLSKVSGTKWLSMDSYPIWANKTLYKSFLFDIGALKTVAMENNAHAHVILQSYGFVENGNADKERMPSEAELRMQAYTAMAFGVDSMSWYVYSPNGHGECDTAVDVNGTIAKQENFDAFKNINAELTAIGKVYNAFNWKGIILGAGKNNGYSIGSWEISKDNDYKAFEMVKGQLGDYELSASDTKHLSSVTTNKTDWNYLMGVMEDALGNEGYVLCNYNSHESDRAQTITLTFASNVTEAVIYRGGVAQTVAVNNKTLAVNLATGEGVIVLPSKLG